MLCDHVWGKVHMLETLFSVPCSHTLNVIYYNMCMYTGLEELLNIRTSRRFIAGRLTSDMETKLNFLTSKVKMTLWLSKYCIGYT